MIILEIIWYSILFLFYCGVIYFIVWRAIHRALKKNNKEIYFNE